MILAWAGSKINLEIKTTFFFLRNGLNYKNAILLKFCSVKITQNSRNELYRRETLLKIFERI